MQPLQEPGGMALFDLSNSGGHIRSPETPAGKPGASSRGTGEAGAAPGRKHSPWTAARDKKKTKNAKGSDEDDPMPSCFSSPGARGGGGHATEADSRVCARIENGRVAATPP